MKRKGTNTVAEEVALMVVMRAVHRILTDACDALRGCITNPIPTQKIIIGICYRDSQSIKLNRENHCADTFNATANT